MRMVPILLVVLSLGRQTESNKVLSVVVDNENFCLTHGLTWFFIFKFYPKYVKSNEILIIFLKACQRSFFLKMFRSAHAHHAHFGGTLSSGALVIKMLHAIFAVKKEPVGFGQGVWVKGDSFYFYQ